MSLRIQLAATHNLTFMRDVALCSIVHLFGAANNASVVGIVLSSYLVIQIHLPHYHIFVSAHHESVHMSAALPLSNIFQLRRGISITSYEYWSLLSYSRSLNESITTFQLQ